MTEGQVTARQKRIVAERARECCEYCGCQLQFSPDSFSVEHIIPFCRQGSSDLSNLALSCQGCNNRKYTSIDAIDPATGEVTPLYHPRQDRWTDHFTWNQDYTLMLGLTPTGRATIERLQLNRSGVVNLRRVLCIAGEHPPQKL